MDKIGKIAALVVVAVLVGSDLVYAGLWGKSEPEASQPVPAALKVVPTQEVLAKKKADLNNTEWAVEVKPMNGKGQAEKDTLTFTDGKVVSKNMGQKGYSPTNYSVRLLDDETFTWETMQTSEKDGVAFWRGDIGPDGIMRGVISKRDKKNNGNDFSFLSVSSQKITPVQPEPAPAQPEPAPAKK
ncbi:MAG: hypothetical protein HY209_06115 [Candidatus Omnitrophica bacterium]|nr:hypothetical protein [Candidatus Omnitrophota bacterium]